MLTCFNVHNTQFVSNTVHYCRSSMPRLSQTLRFLQSPSFWQAQSALIGQLTQCIVIGRTLHARVRNVTPLSIIPSFSFQIGFISSSPKGEQSRVTDTVLMLVCICITLDAIKTISDGLFTRCDMTLFPPPTHTHTHTHTHTQCITRKTPHLNSKYQILKLITKHTYRRWFRSVRITSSPRFTKLSSIKCVAQTRTFGLCCCVVNKS